MGWGDAVGPAAGPAAGECGLGPRRVQRTGEGMPLPRSGME